MSWLLNVVLGIGTWGFVYFAYRHWLHSQGACHVCGEHCTGDTCDECLEFTS